MPLSAANFTQNGTNTHQDHLQFFNLLTGVMNDQAVTIANTLAVASVLTASSDVIVAGALKFGTSGSSTTTIYSPSAGQINVTASSGFWLNGGLYFTPDNSSDIGATATGRPRNLFVAGAVNAATATISGATRTATLGVNQAAPGSGSVAVINGGLGVGDYVPATSPVSIFYVKGNIYQTNGVWAIGQATNGPLPYIALNFQPSIGGVTNPTGFNLRPVYDTAATGPITNFISAVNVPAGLSTSNVYAIQAGGVGMGSGAAVAQARGLWVNNQGATGVANAYGIFVDVQSGASGDNLAIVIGSPQQRIRNPANNTASLSVESANGYVFCSGLNGGYLGGNAYYDGSNWQRFSTATAASYAASYPSVPFSVSNAAAGSNPISWTQLLILNTVGCLTLPYAGGTPANPTIQIGNGAYISGKDGSGNSTPMLVVTGDNWVSAYCGSAGFLFTNQANTQRIATLSNAGDLSLHRVTVYDILYFYNQALSIVIDPNNFYYRCTTSGNHYFQAMDGSYRTCFAAAFTPSSARKLKTDIVRLEDPLSFVLDDDLHAVRYTEIASGKASLGFVADDWVPRAREVVAFDSNDEVAALDYDRIGAITFEALKVYVMQTNARLDALERRAA